MLKSTNWDKVWGTANTAETNPAAFGIDSEQVTFVSHPHNAIPWAPALYKLFDIPSTNPNAVFFYKNMLKFVDLLKFLVVELSAASSTFNPHNRNTIL
jgi:hypothetical protein